MFRYPVHPSAITIGSGLEIAWKAFTASAVQWLPFVLLMGLVQALPTAMAGDPSTWYRVDFQEGVFVQSDSYRSAQVTGSAIVMVVELVCGWILTAIVVAGLRSRPVAAGWVVSRGIQSVAAGILVFVPLALGALITIGVASRLEGMGLLLLAAVFVGLIYVAIRMAFTTLAVFDGFSPIGGISESWGLSARSVLRLLGWALMITLLGFLVSIVVGFFAAGFAQSDMNVAGSIVTGLATSFLSAYSLFLLAVLYESQRSRRDYGMPPGPYRGYPAGYSPLPYTPPAYPGQGALPPMPPAPADPLGQSSWRLPPEGPGPGAAQS